MSRQSLRAAWSAAVAVLALTTTAASATASDEAAEVAAKPRWQHVSGLDHGHGNALTAAAWASGRAWLLLGSRRQLTVSSARVSGGALTSQQTTREQAPFAWYPNVVGSEVVFSATRTTTGSAPLLANGRVGPTEAASPDPMESNVGIPVAAARIGERVHWVLAGGVPIGEGLSYRPTLWACCEDTGAARNLSHLGTMRRQSPPRAHALGADAKGRLWLAWLDGRLGRAEVRIVQLDPVTLAPQTRKALVAPVARVSEPWLRTAKLQLACRATCRLIVGSYYDLPTRGSGQRIVTWAPGEPAATRVDLKAKPDPEGYYRQPILVAADYRPAGGLAIAYLSGSSDHGRTLTVVVADERGGRSRVVGSSTMPGRSRGLPAYTFSAGTFTPSGFVFAQTYSNYGTRGHVLATVVPLR